MSGHQPPFLVQYNHGGQSFQAILRGAETWAEAEQHLKSIGSNGRIIGSNVETFAVNDLNRPVLGGLGAVEDVVAEPVGAEAMTSQQSLREQIAAALPGMTAWSRRDTTEKIMAIFASQPQDAPGDAGDRARELLAFEMGVETIELGRFDGGPTAEAAIRAIERALASQPTGRAEVFEIAAWREMLEALCQYESDLLHPPTGDSRQRRLERVRKVIAKYGEAQ